MKHNQSSSQASILDSSPEKKARIHKLSIQKALEAAQNNNKRPKGLLLFFKKATKEEHDQYQQKMNKEIKCHTEDYEYLEKKLQQKKDEKRRSAAQEWKHNQRRKLKDVEIKNGTQSPRGRKHKICNAYFLMPHKS